MGVLNNNYKYMNEELEYLLSAMNTLMSDEVIEKASEFSWKLFSSLKQKGFNDEQAMKILTNWNKNNK